MQRIIEKQTDEKIQAIYSALNDSPKVKWKDSIRKVMDSPMASEPGLDTYGGCDQVSILIPPLFRQLWSKSR